jgi:hypothetical protein
MGYLEAPLSLNPFGREPKTTIVHREAARHAVHDHIIVGKQGHAI